MAILCYNITSSTDKYYSLDSEDVFRSGYRNVSHQQQFFSDLPSPGRSQNTKRLDLYRSTPSFLHYIEKGLSLSTIKQISSAEKHRYN